MAYKIYIKNNFLYVDDTELVPRALVVGGRDKFRMEEVAVGSETYYISRDGDKITNKAIPLSEILKENDVAYTATELEGFITNFLDFKFSQVGETVSTIGTEDSLDDATAAVPLVVIANTDKKITNNAFELFSSLPSGLTHPIWDGVNNRLDFSELKVGDALYVSVNFSAITTSANTDIGIGISGGTVAASSFKRLLGRLPFKTNKTYLDETIKGVVLMKSQATIDGFGELFLRTDANCSVIIKGIQIVHQLKGSLL